MSESKTGGGLVQFVMVVIFIIGSFAVSWLLQSSYEPPGRNSEEDAVPLVETMTLTPESYQLRFETTGIVSARNNVGIVPEVSGRVVRVDNDFFAGGSFRKNETVFEIDPEDFSLAVQRLEAEVARAETALTLAEAETNAATEEWRQLYEDKDVPSLVARVPQLMEARANVKAAQAQLRDAQLDLRRSRYRFPFPGRVISSTIAAGQYVQAGQNYGEVFDRSSLEIESSLNDEQLEWLRGAPKTDVMIRADYLGEEREYRGTVLRGGATLDPTTRFAQIRFGFARAPEDIVPGVFADISVAGPRYNDVYVVPANALEDETYLWQIAEDGALVKTQPRIIYLNGEEAVLSGLQGTPTVVISKMDGPYDGMKVTTGEEKMDAEEAAPKDASDE